VSDRRTIAEVYLVREKTSEGAGEIENRRAIWKRDFVVATPQVDKVPSPQYLKVGFRNATKLFNRRRLVKVQDSRIKCPHVIAL
jgi:hypothetical protein